jgi:hypothetical protein
MEEKGSAAEDTITDLIDDDEYYTVKQNKQQIENATWAIHIFAVISLLFYIIYLLINHQDINWVNFTINIILISVYFCLGVYSSYKPFTAFVVTLCVIVLIFLLEAYFTAQFSFRGLAIKLILAVYIARRLKAAKTVERYEAEHPKEKKQ